MQIIDKFTLNNYQILDNFELLLNYILNQSPIVSKKSNRLLSKNVLELNQELSKTLKLDLKQHNQTSYPHINSLILLFRASGLGIVSYAKRKLFLTIDKSIYKQWTTLNNTEKYINLLIAWITNGVPAIIGIKNELINSVENTLDFMLSLSPKEIITNQDDLKELESPSYSVGTHNIMLLEMFGFVKIKDNSNTISKKWKIKQIQITKLGSFVYKQIQKLMKNFDLYSYGNYFPPEFKTQLQSIFNKLLINYKKNIVIPQNKYKNKEYIFRVSTGRIFRKITIPTDYNLGSFWSFVIDSFNLYNNYTFRLIIKNRFGYNETYNKNGRNDYDGSPCADDFTMNELNIMSGTIMNFEYFNNYDTKRKFEIICETIQTNKNTSPQIIEIKGEIPKDE